MDWKTLNAFDFSKKIYRKPEVQKKYEGEMNKYLNYEKDSILEERIRKR